MDASDSPPLTVQSLHEAPLFAGLDDPALETIWAMARSRRLDAGERFFNQGDPAHSLYVLAQGRVRLTQVTPEGRQVIVRIAAPREIFGAVAAMGLAEYPASAEAQTPSRALLWDGAEMEALFEQFPRLARNLIHLMAGHVQELQDRLREMATERVEQRIARTVLRLIRHAGRKVDDGVLLDMPLTRQDLAEMNGATLHTVSRILSRWESDGITGSDNRRILVRVPHRLVAIAEDLPDEQAGREI